MINKEINEQLIDFDLKMKDNFVQRHAAELSGKTLDEIISSYIRWKYNRYTVIDQDTFFAVVDMYEQKIPVAMITKGLDPDAYNHAWGIAESLNDLPDHYVSIGSEVFPVSNFNTFPDFDSGISSDDLFMEEENTMSSLSIDEVINGAKKFFNNQENDDDGDVK